MRSRERDERGAVAIVAAALVLVLIGIAAITVDIGMQRVARRDMQSLADVIALDLVRSLGGRTAADLMSPANPSTNPPIQTLANLSRDRNTGTVGETPTVLPEVGEFDKTTGKFTVVTGSTVPTAVRVTASTTVDFAFGLATSGGASRLAVAAVESGGCFKIGSVTAGLDSTKSPVLNALIGKALGSSVNLSLVDYQGLASAKASLLSILQVGTLGVGTFNELVNTNISLATFYKATATVLTANGKTAQASVFNALAAQVGPLPKVKLADVLNLGQGDNSAANASLNALDLLYTTALVANGQSSVSVPSLTVALPGVSSLTGSLQVSQPAKLGCGRVGEATASSEAVSTELTGTIASLPGVTALSGLGLTINSTAVKIESLHVGAAVATGTLTGVTCGTPTSSKPDKESVLAKPGLVKVTGNLTVTLGAQMKLPLGLFDSLVLVGLEIKIPAVINATSSATGGTTVDLSFPSLADYDIPQPAGSAGVGLSSSAITLDRDQTKVTATLLGIPLPLGSLLADVLNGAMSITGSLTTALNTALIVPLLNLLGVRLGSADVFGVPRPTCGNPALRR